MKKLVLYLLLSIMVLIILPFFIVWISGGIKNYAIDGFRKSYTSNNTTVNVFVNSENKNEKMELEDYIKGVVAAEMPASFELEALKAQAVAARTYVLSRKEGLFNQGNPAHSGSDVCTEVHCQAWISKADVFKTWGDKVDQYWAKIEEAVSETTGLVITYNNELINPLFHSNSGGFTENVNEVWSLNDNVPYLVSVKSPGEETFQEQYNGGMIISYSDFIAKLNNSYKDIKFVDKDIFKEIKILSKTTGNRVKEIKVGSSTITGVAFRNVLGLKSANFTIEKSGQNSLKITTIGYGHGVGMSQCGADYMAQQGRGFIEILKYYYTNTDVVSYVTMTYGKNK